MLEISQFEFIKKKYGHYASWAVWAEGGKKPKENIGDLSIFDVDKNKELLKQLQPNIILVGLNVAERMIQKPLANFHDSSPYAMDYKIRYALKGTLYYGAYMTDIIKNFQQSNSKNVTNYLRSHTLFEKNNIELFREEINDLQVNNPEIIAFGKDTYEILDRNLSREYKIKRIPHYSHHINQEDYKKVVQEILQISIPKE